MITIQYDLAGAYRMKLRSLGAGLAKREDVIKAGKSASIPDGELQVDLKGAYAELYRITLNKLKVMDSIKSEDVIEAGRNADITDEKIQKDLQGAYAIQYVKMLNSPQSSGLVKSEDLVKIGRNAGIADEKIQKDLQKEYTIQYANMLSRLQSSGLVKSEDIVKLGRNAGIADEEIQEDLQRAIKDLQTNMLEKYKIGLYLLRGRLIGLGDVIEASIISGKITDEQLQNDLKDAYSNPFSRQRHLLHYSPAGRCYFRPFL